jgi:hypothetical protein
MCSHLMAYLVYVLVHHGYSSGLFGTIPTTIHYTPHRFILKYHRRYGASQLRMLHIRRCDTPYTHKAPTIQLYYPKKTSSFVLPL